MQSLKTLCQECGGKCCNGTMFNEVLIRQSEVTKLRKLGAKIVRDIPFPEMIMPVEKGCPFLKDGRCSIYNDRPRSCMTFDCRRYK